MIDKLLLYSIETCLYAHTWLFYHCLPDMLHLVYRSAGFVSILTSFLSRLLTYGSAIIGWGGVPFTMSISKSDDCASQYETSVLKWNQQITKAAFDWYSSTTFPLKYTGNSGEILFNMYTKAISDLKQRIKKKSFYQIYGLIIQKKIQLLIDILLLHTLGTCIYAHIWLFHHSVLV